MGCKLSKRRSTSSLDKHKDRSATKFNSAVLKTVFSVPDFDPLAKKPRMLTDYEKSLVRSSWAEFSQGKNVLRNTAMAFVRMFILSPDSATLFKLDSTEIINEQDMALNEKALLKNALMRQHLTYVVDFIGKCMENLDNIPVLTKNATVLGSKHVGYGAKLRYLKNICEGFMFAIEKCLWPNVDKELMEAWEVVFLHISYAFAQGFKGYEEKSIVLEQEKTSVQEQEKSSVQQQEKPSAQEQDRCLPSQVIPKTNDTPREEGSEVKISTSSDV